MKRNMARKLFTVGQQLLLRRMFGEMYIQPKAFKQPAVVLVNHSSFYDGLVVFELIRKGYLPQNAVAVMDEGGQQSMPLFQHIGTIPVSQPMKLSEYKDMLKAMAHDTLVIFPQGMERHVEQRPMQLQNGIEGLLKKYPAHHVVCLSIYYTVSSHIRAELACKMDVLRADHRPEKWSLRDIETWMTGCLDELKTDVLRGDFERYVRL